MPIEAFAKQHCSVARPMAILGERWAILVLRELFLGFRRFDLMQKRLGVASNVLSARLTTLVDEGIVERRRYSEHPERYEYRLTDKGRDLQPILMQLMRWADEHMPVPGGPIHELTHDDCGHAFHPVETCSHCGGEVNAHNVTRRMGPGATKAQKRDEQHWLKARDAAARDEADAPAAGAKTAR
jgi:DNA-binding HxlR family transcriptional regulator